MIGIAVESPTHVLAICRLSEAPILCLLTVGNAMLQCLQCTTTQLCRMLANPAVCILDIWLASRTILSTRSSITEREPRMRQCRHCELVTSLGCLQPQKGIFSYFDESGPQTARPPFYVNGSRNGSAPQNGEYPIKSRRIPELLLCCNCSGPQF